MRPQNGLNAYGTHSYRTHFDVAPVWVEARNKKQMACRQMLCMILKSCKGLHDNHALQANTLHDWQLHRLCLHKDKQCHVFYHVLIRGGEAPPYN